MRMTHRTGAYRHARRLAPAALLPLVLAFAAGAAPGREAAVDYTRDVRPILAENCFACHGADAGKRQAGLRLDVAEGAVLRLPSGRSALVPGRPEASELMARITAENARAMPPAATGKKLSARQIDTLRRWVRQGGQYASHWAYSPIRRPAVPPAPKGSLSRWARGPVDRFLLARLAKEGLRPAPEADRRTLLRRISLDLTGLPPRPAEIAAFLDDRRPDAYERQVDRLLASPHYGERMAQYWLDLVRYADTVGYHGDQDVSVWPYRDYVIRAFNSNKPFSEFTMEQLAGDLLPGATVEQRVASAYNRLGMMSTEGGAQDKEYRAKYASDRVRNASVVWLGSTVGCAECHDHKFDPITQKDFYRFAAFFADLKEKGFYDGGFDRGDWGPTMKLPSDAQKAQLARLDAEIAAAKEGVASIPDADLTAERERWEGEVRVLDAAKSTAWTVAAPTEAASSGGATMTVGADGVVQVSGALPDRDTYTVTLPAGDRPIAAVRLEALSDESLPGNSVARSGYYFVLSEFELTLQSGAASPRPIPIAGVLVSRQDEGFPGYAAVDGRLDTGWAQVLGGGGTRTVVFRLREPVRPGADAKLVVRLRHETQPRLSIGKFRLSLSPVAGADLSPQSLPDAVWSAIRKPAAERTQAEAAVVAAHYRGIAAGLAEPRSRLARLETERSLLLGEIPQTLVSESIEPRVIRVLPRGNWMDDSGEVVRPGPPDFLTAARTATGEEAAGRANRRDLAAWIASPENPLAARVFVNRLWKLFFGTGLAKNADDFGAQGEPPVHPELLDWLASDFRSGWDVKRTIRRIVTSTAYRQSSRATPEVAARDPYNRLYARQSALRLDAEFVRDAALAAAGLLSPKTGGRSVRPYQPRGYYAALNFPRREWSADTGEELYRRGLYTLWRRTFLHPSLLAFDAPTREECTVSRTVSNTPMQALVLLNDPIFVEAARGFGERILREGGASFERRLEFAYQCALSRPPRLEETAVMRKLYQRQRARYAAGRADAERLIAAGERPTAGDLDAVELAAWTAVARALLNLHETITRS